MKANPRLRRALVPISLVILGMLAAYIIYLWTDFLYAPFRSKDSPNEKVLTFYAFPHANQIVNCRDGDSVATYRFSGDGHFGKAIYYSKRGTAIQTAPTDIDGFKTCAVDNQGAPVYLRITKKTGGIKEVSIYRSGHIFQSLSQPHLGSLLEFSPKWLLFASTTNKDRTIAVNVNSGETKALSIRPRAVYTIRNDNVWDYQVAQDRRQLAITNILTGKKKVLNAPNGLIFDPYGHFAFRLKKTEMGKRINTITYTVTFLKNHVQKIYRSNPYLRADGNIYYGKNYFLLVTSGSLGGNDLYLVNVQTQKARHFMVHGVVTGFAMLDGTIFFSKTVYSRLSLLYSDLYDSLYLNGDNSPVETPVYVYMIHW